MKPLKPRAPLEVFSVRLDGDLLKAFRVAIKQDHFKFADWMRWAIGKYLSNRRYEIMHPKKKTKKR